MKSISALVLGLLAPALFAADWPQWQGPARDNVSRDTDLLKAWPKQGPPLAWTFRDAGNGYSAPAVVGDRLYLMGARGADSYLFALDATMGKELWKLRLGPKFTFNGNQWGEGPRGTPAVARGFVYALGGGGAFVCAQADNGKEIWRVHMLDDLGGEVNQGSAGAPRIGSGYCWSPLVDGDQVICFPGGSRGAVAALACKDGKVRWRSKQLKDPATYSSPIVAEVAGVKQVVVVVNAGLAGLDAGNGKLLWKYSKRPPYPGDYTIATPLVHDGRVYISIGPNAGCDLIALARKDGTFAATKVYANKIMKNELGGVVLLDGRVYGYSANRGWMCQDFAKGTQIWARKDQLGAGSVIGADGQLYCYEEDSGVVALVDAAPKGWKENGRFEIPQHAKKAPSGRHWTHPVIANGRLYLRDQELLFCYDIKGK